MAPPLMSRAKRLRPRPASELTLGELAEDASRVGEIVLLSWNYPGIDEGREAPGREVSASAPQEAALQSAVAGGRFDPTALETSRARVGALRAWLGTAGPPPDLAVVGSLGHRDLSRELAERSMTLARGPLGHLLPDATILAVMPQPTDLTPADTSSTVAPGLGRALRTRFGSVEEVVVGIAPTDAEIAGVRARALAGDVDAVVVGTIDAIRQPAQAELVRALAGSAKRTLAVALRTPWDVALYPDSIPAICTYSILPDSLEALASALAGVIPFAGRLPVAVPGFTE